MKKITQVFVGEPNHAEFVIAFTEDSIVSYHPDDIEAIRERVQERKDQVHEDPFYLTFSPQDQLDQAVIMLVDAYKAFTEAVDLVDELPTY